MTISGVFISIFDKIMPYSPWLILLYFVAVFGWALQGRSAFGHGASNILNEALMKCTGKSLVFIRFCIEITFLIIAALTMPSMINIYTITLTFGCPYAIKYIYRLVGYNPTQVQHDYLISRKKSSKGASL